MTEKKIGYSEPSSYIPKDIRKKYGVGEYFKQELGNFDSVWKKIVQLEGETFYTATGLPFIYKVIDDHQICKYEDMLNVASPLGDKKTLWEEKILSLGIKVVDEQEIIKNK